MKLLIYSHFFAPSVGGVESVVLSLIRGLAGLRMPNGSAQFDVTVVTQTDAANCDDRALSYRVIRRPKLSELWQLIRASDLIHMAGPVIVPLLLCKIAGKRAVVEHHGFQTICPNGQLFIESSCTPCPGHFMQHRHSVCLRCNRKEGWLRSIRLWLLTFVRRFLCAGIAANVAPTEWLAGMLQLPKLIHISHGLGCRSVLLRDGPFSSTPTIAFQGRLVSTKGVSLLLKAAHILLERGRAFDLLIIGDGPELASLQELAEGSGLSGCVRFAGRLPDPELDDALSHAKLVVVPSLGGEVFGMVLAENMQRAIPVIASNLGCFVEVVGDSGRIFRTGDASDLACEIELLLSDTVQAMRLGAAGARRVSEFYSERKMIEEHARMYHEVAELARF
jgi:glycosyltransferase involved in cell wall biosynthesis